MSKPDQNRTVLRRRFLQGMALAVPGVALLGCGTERPHAELDAANAPGSSLDASEKRFLDAAVERLIPADSLGAGAREAGVVTFIDRQLAGPFGLAQTWYLRGPWKKGTKQQGYQSKLTPAEMYHAAIRDIETYCRHKYRKNFEALSPNDQDSVLHGLETGGIDLPNVPAKAFFKILWNNTQQGYLADPMYGGNRDFAGWKLIGFPGPRYNYVAEIEQFGKPFKMPTVGLRGRGNLHRNGG
ncbi:MAG: gluconate 2-dehydrogenase subunit 3 family protein [Rhodanobacteraceae bacterium]